MTKIISVLMVCAGALLAQDGTEKATVPLHDPARPARIRAHLMSGGITVRGADRRDVLVEARSGERGEREERHERHRAGAEGMKRAIRAGVTTVEHGTLMDDEAIELFKKHGTYYVPTIIAGRTAADHNYIPNLCTGFSQGHGKGSFRLQGLK